MNTTATLKQELLAAMTQVMATMLDQRLSALQTVAPAVSTQYTTPDVSYARSHSTLSRSSSGGSTLSRSSSGGSTLSRSSSGGSTMSERSAISLRRNITDLLSDEDDEEPQRHNKSALDRKRRRDIFGESDPSDSTDDKSQCKINADESTKKKKRRRKTKQDPQLDAVVKIITTPVLQHIDAKFLAPQTSRMFYRMPKKKANADGTHELKQFPDMDTDVFKQEVHPVIREIIGAKGMTDRSTVNLYLAAALKIVAKRRANHTQHWRLYNTHKPLKYGTGVDYRDQSNAQFKSRRKLETSCPPPPPPKSPNKLPASISNTQTAAASININTQAAAHPTCDNNPATATCITCNKQFLFNDSLDWTKEKRPMRCDDCFNSHVQEKYIPMVHENRPSGQQVRENACRERDENGHKKRTKPTSCKHCGSTTHVSRASKKCPHFKPRKSKGKKSAKSKKNVRQPPVLSVAPAQAAVQEPAAPTAEVRPPSTPPVSTLHENTTACVDCGKNVTYKSCFPQEHGANIKKKVRCGDCWDKAPASTPADNLITATDNGATPDTPVDTIPSPADGAPPSTPAAAPPVTNTTPTIPTFSPQVGDNVFARWKKNMWYLAHVTHHVGDKYTVYYVEDSKVKSNLTSVDLRPAPLTSFGLGCMTRSMLVRQNVEWWFDGAEDLAQGHWIVRSIGPQNTFVCVRRTGGSTSSQNVEKFDIGYVMKTIRDARERVRQR